MSKKKSGWSTGEILLSVAIWLGLVLLSPVLIPLLVYAFAKEKYEGSKLRRFLRRNNGAKFFCYTSKRTGINFIREKILPQLDPDIQIIYMSEKGRVNLGDDSLINTLIGMEAGGAKRGGYPCVAKVVEGKLVSVSLNTEIYRIIARNGAPDKIIDRINTFYGSVRGSKNLLN